MVALVSFVDTWVVNHTEALVHNGGNSSWPTGHSGEVTAETILAGRDRQLRHVSGLVEFWRSGFSWSAR